MTEKKFVTISSRHKNLLRSLPGQGFDIFISTAQRHQDRYSVGAFLSMEEILSLKGPSMEVEVHEPEVHELSGGEDMEPHIMSADAESAFAPGDDPDRYMTAEEIDRLVRDTATKYSSICSLIKLPHATHEKKASHALKISAKPKAKNPAVLFVAGLHAREIMNPDMLSLLSRKICAAYVDGSNIDFTLTGQSQPALTYRSKTIKDMLNKLDIYTFPMANPDGRSFVQSKPDYGTRMWRKNRNPNNGDSDRGVDLNRNYDFMWDSSVGTSSLRKSAVYKGEAPGSEPETKNVLHLIETIPNLYALIDIHSFSGLILFPWGSDETQSEIPQMNFTNDLFNGLRGKKEDAYLEYMSGPDLEVYTAIGRRIQTGIKNVAGTEYRVGPGHTLYPTTATLMDYPYSRHLAQEHKNASNGSCNGANGKSGGKIWSFTIESAPLKERGNYLTSFQPDYSEARNIMAEVSAGLLECCRALVDHNEDKLLT